MVIAFLYSICFCSFVFYKHTAAILLTHIYAVLCSILAAFNYYSLSIFTYLYLYAFFHINDHLA
jgi:hypothetical protein